MEIVEQLGEDDTYTFLKAGLGRKAIEEIIRKHMQERRRKENNPLNDSDNSSGSQDSKLSLASARNEKVKNYESYFNDGKYDFLRYIFLQTITNDRERYSKILPLQQRVHQLFESWITLSSGQDLVLGRPYTLYFLMQHKQIRGLI